MREYVAIVVLDLNLTTWLLAHAIGALPHLGAEDDSIEPLLVMYCSEAILPAAFKYLGTLHCSERDEPGHSYPHTKSLVGKNCQGEWKSKGSDEYKPELCGLIALTLLEGHNFSVPTVSDVFDEFASLAPSTTSLASEHVDGGGDELSNAGNSFENDDEVDDAETLDAPTSLWNDFA